MFRIVSILFAMILFFAEGIGNANESVVELGRKYYVTLEHVNFVDDAIYIEVEGITYKTPAINTDENGYYIDRVSKSGNCRWYEWQCRNKKCKACNYRGIDRECRKCQWSISE